MTDPTPVERALVEQYAADRRRERRTDPGRRALDNLDPNRPLLAQLVDQAIGLAEQRGEQRAAGDAGLRARLEALIEQRTALRDERVRVARRYLDEGNLQPAASELAWASALDEQLGALRVLLIEPAGEGS